MKLEQAVKVCQDCHKEKKRVMTAKPLNAETPTEYLRSWITPNDVFFDRNQGAIPPRCISLERWTLTITGEVETPLTFRFDEIRHMPKAIVSNTLECSGNGRSLLGEKASGNPWTIGGVGNAVYGGVWLRELLEKAGLTPAAGHVAFEERTPRWESSSPASSLRPSLPSRCLARRFQPGPS